MKYLKNFLKGLVVGVATLVPGVSGGTMAIILGIYDNLIRSVSGFFENWKKSTVFLLQIGLGALTGLLLFSNLLETAINNYPYVMRFLFIGVICGGIPVLFKQARAGKKDKWDFVMPLIGFCIVLLMSSEPAATSTFATAGGFTSVIFLFIAGIIMAIALILPGISGSYMLLTLGLYDVTLNAINNKILVFLIPLGLGIIVSTLATAKTIEKLLKNYPSKTYMMILGFVVGSLIPVFPGIPEGFSMIASIAAFIVGFLAIRWISKKEID